MRASSVERGPGLSHSELLRRADRERWRLVAIDIGNSPKRHIFMRPVNNRLARVALTMQKGNSAPPGMEVR